MKKVLSLAALALLLSSATATQAQSNNIVPTGSDSKAKVSDEKERSPAGSTASAAVVAATDPASSTSDAPAKKVTTVPSGGNSKSSSTPEGETSMTTDAANPLTTTYRVGVGDVLDIRLLNVSTPQSSLFSVMAGGLLEYPLAGEPFPVTGLTTDEIDQRLTEKVKLFENPQIVVSVREYASHKVLVSGLVSEPGTKTLRREAMPLYVLLAEAQVKPEAGRATIVRTDGQTVVVDLSDEKPTTLLVMPGDVITVSVAPPAPPKYFYIGGQINSPGQKEFHAGLTLTQAVLASGGTTRFAGGKVKVYRQGADGRLVTTEYNLKHIESGKVPDPEIQSGDRLDVGRGGW